MPDPPSCVLAAVSGGGDSVALFHLLASLKKELGIDRLGIAHVNHGLRGAESDRDEDFVCELARAAGLQFHVKKLQGKSQSEPGVETWAREERYRFFHQIRQDHGYRYIATGHTMDDQAETVIQRLTRGAGLRGLAGIRPLRDDGIIRPLLACRRSELRIWLEKESLVFREDSSNSNTHFERNRIRMQVLPALSQLHGDAATNLALFAEVSLKLWQLIEPAVNNWIESNVLINDIDRLHFKTIGLQSSPYAVEAIAELLRRKGIQFGRYHLEKLVGLAGPGEEKILLMKDGWRCTLTPEKVEFALKEKSGSEGAFRYAIRLPGITKCGSHGAFSVEKVFNTDKINPISNDNKNVYLAFPEETESLIFRSVNKDDVFFPYGPGREYEVFHFLKKQGMRLGKRLSTGVVARQDGTVTWVPGIRIDERFSVRAGSKNIYRMIYEPNQ